MSRLDRGVNALARILLAATLLLGAGRAQDAWRADEPVETKHPNGQVHERYTLDAAGKKSGTYEEFRADGTLALRCVYKSDVRQGHAEEFFADGKTVQSSGEYRQGERDGAWLFVTEGNARHKKAEYRNGVMSGAVSIEIDGHVVSKQKWKDGELERLDDIVPFAVRRAALLERLTAILAPPSTPIDVSKDPLAADRAAALRRLQAYRALCGVRYETLALVPEWNTLCDAASEVCRQNGEISHTPPKPPGFDDARYRQGCEGASHSNLSTGVDLPDSVDSYMNDSDESNIARIGHRRWCLDPLMGKTGFGRADSFCAMWAMDQGGKAPRGLAAVLYPPPGYCPVNMFSPTHAFSISPLKGGEVKKQDVRARVRALDQDWIPGNELALDHLDSIESGYGTGGCIVFRPAGLKVAPGARYLVEVSIDAGKTQAWRYVVAFCEAARSASGK
jgi:hypothetical protein